MHSALKNEVINSVSQKVPLHYQETMVIAGRNESVTLCEDCFLNLHDTVSKRAYGNWKQELNKRIVFDATACPLLTSLSKSKKVKDLTKKHYRNILEARAALGASGLDEQSLHLTCLPSGPRYLQAYHWMSNFFSSMGDYAPNRDNKVQIPGIYTKSSIYKIYEKMRHNHCYSYFS